MPSASSGWNHARTPDIGVGRLGAVVGAGHRKTRVRARDVAYQAQEPLRLTIDT